MVAWKEKEGQFKLQTFRVPIKYMKRSTFHHGSTPERILLYGNPGNKRKVQHNLVPKESVTFVQWTVVVFPLNNGTAASENEIRGTNISVYLFVLFPVEVGIYAAVFIIFKHLFIQK